MQPTLSVRQGTIEEVVAASRCLPEFSEPYGAVEYQKRLGGKRHLILVAVAQNRVVGFKVGYEREETFYSWMGGVLPAFRRQGVATVLAEAQEEWVRQQGFSSILLKTRNCHRDMLIFALKRDFQITGMIPKETIGQSRIWLQKTFD